MKILLVRHGETEANAQRIIQGHADTPLTEKGRQQVAALGRRLQSEKINVCYSSDLKRAQDTASIISEFTGIQAEPHSDLRERCYGEFEGTPFVTYEAALAASGFSRQQFQPSGGESYVMVEKRVAAFFSWCSELHPDKSVLLVAHGGTNKMLLKYLLKASDDNLRVFEQSNACLNILEIDPNWQARSLLINCTAHMQGI